MTNASSPTTAQAWHILPAGPSVSGQLIEVWRHRHLFRLFTLRALFDLHRNAILGTVWMVIRPLMMAVPAVFVIGRVLGISVAPLPLPLFVLVGLACWIFVRRNIQWFTKSMQKNAAVLSHVYVSPLLLMVASVSLGLVEFVIVMGVVAVAAVYYGPIAGLYYLDFGWHNLAIAPALILAFLLAVAIGCFTSILNALARDTWLTLRYVLSFWMLVTPIVYPMQVIPEQYRWIAYVNPLAPIVELFRWGVLHYETVQWEFVALAAGEILVLLMLGIWFFGKQQNRLFDHM
jgi:homopolymeric O-antigen transport system permease protein